MRKPLSSGTLWWLLKEMPPTLKSRLNEELEQIDTRRRMARQKGDTRITGLVQHLRWLAEDQADLGEMRLTLYDVLTNYLPLTMEHVRKNELPSLSDCSFFWGLQIKQLEKESTKTNSIPV